MARTGAILAIVVLLCVAGLGAWWYLRPGPVAESRQAQGASGTGAAGTEPAEPRYPVAEAESQPQPDESMPSDTAESGTDTEATEPREASPPLPPLEASDGFVHSTLRQLFPAAALDRWLKDRRIVERIVVTVNSLDGDAIPLRFWPLRHIEGLPRVIREGDRLYWSPSNAERYRPLVGILTSTEPEAVARIYFRNYPLFQQAYDSLGLERVYFNDRVVEIVDHLLGAPEIPPGFELRQPKVLYEFADSALERESWGRKLLLRMGPYNAAAVKTWLERLRLALVRGQAQTVEP